MLKMHQKLLGLGEFLMTKSLTNSLQSAANNIRGPVPFISSVLEQANRKLFHRQDATRPSHDLHFTHAEECFETLPPIKPIPSDVKLSILTSILDDYKESHHDTKNLDDLCKLKSEEIKRKLELYNTIADREQYGQVLHHSTRNGKKDLLKDNGFTDTVDAMATDNEQNCDKNRTGVEQKVNVSKSCVMTMSQGWLLDSRNTEYIEKEIEDKEKILAKMLDLDVLNPVECSIPLSPEKHHPIEQDANQNLTTPPNKRMSIKAPNSNKTFTNKVPTEDATPKFEKIPNTWNLDNISLQINNQKSILSVISAQRIKHEPKSPDETLGSDWEIV